MHLSVWNGVGARGGFTPKQLKIIITIPKDVKILHFLRENKKCRSDFGKNFAKTYFRPYSRGHLLIYGHWSAPQNPYFW